MDRDYKNPKILQQECCLHVNLRGEYMKPVFRDDSYWVDFVCPDCGKRWTEDQADVRFDQAERTTVTKEGFSFIKVKR